MLIVTTSLSSAFVLFSNLVEGFGYICLTLNSDAACPNLPRGDFQRSGKLEKPQLILVFFSFFSAVLFDQIGPQKVREAGGFHVSYFRQERMAWCRFMTKKTKMFTTIKFMTMKV